jgi:hypothetical protein
VSLTRNPIGYAERIGAIRAEHFVVKVKSSFVGQV